MQISDLQRSIAGNDRARFSKIRVARLVQTVAALDDWVRPFQFSFATGHPPTGKRLAQKRR